MGSERQQEGSKEKKQASRRPLSPDFQFKNAATIMTTREGKWFAQDCTGEKMTPKWTGVLR